MTLPTHDEMLRERFDAAKKQAGALLTDIAQAQGAQFEALVAIAPVLAEYAAYFSEAITYPSLIAWHLSRGLKDPGHDATAEEQAAYAEARAAVQAQIDATLAGAALRTRVLGSFSG